MNDRGIFEPRTQRLFALGQLLASLGFGAGVAGMIALDPGFGAINLVPPAIGVAGGGWAWLSMRRGQERRGAWVLLISALLAVTGAMMSMGGFSGQSPTIFVWAVLMAGLLLGRRFAFVAAAVASVVQILLGVAELGGVFAPALTPMDPNLRLLAVGVPVVIFWLVALLSWLSAKHLGSALEENHRLLDHAQQKLGPVSLDLAMGMEELVHATQMVGDQARQLSRSAEDQARYLERGRGSAEAVALSTRTLGERARKVEEATDEAQRLLEETAAVFSRLRTRLEGIGEVTVAVRELAEKTDILALNAALEAARAGEHGRGFAQVAEQVRDSAETSGAAAREIGDLSLAIEDDLAQVLDSVERVRRAIGSSADLATATVTAMGEQESASTAIVDALTELSVTASEAAGAAERIVRSVDEQGHSVINSTGSAAAVAALVEEIERRGVKGP